MFVYFILSLLISISIMHSWPKMVGRGFLKKLKKNCSESRISFLHLSLQHRLLSKSGTPVLGEVVGSDDAVVDDVDHVEEDGEGGVGDQGDAVGPVPTLAS